MGFLGMSGKTWKKIGKYALQAAPIVAAPFTGGASLLAIGAGSGALSGALGGGGWKGAALGGALGAIPGGGAGGAAAGAGKAAAGTVAKTGLKAGLTQAAKSGAKQVAGGLASKYLPGPAGQIAGAAIGGYGGGANLGANLRNAGKAALTQGGATATSGALQKAGVPAGGANVFANYLGGKTGGFGANSLVPQQGGGNAGGGTFGGLNWTQPQGGTPIAQAGGGGGIKNWLGQNAPGLISTATTALGGNQQPVPGQPPRNPTAGLPQPSGPGVGAGRPGTPGGTAAGPYQAGGGGGDAQTWQDKYGSIIGQGIGLGAGALAGQWATRSAMNRSPEEMAALGGAQGVGKGAASAAEAAMGQSKPWMQQAGNYYSTLLSGNRAAMSQATAAPMAQLSQQYRGAERGLERSGVRGAARDVAAGELGRERVGKMAGLTTGVQPYAAEQLGKLGLDAQGNAAGLYGVAGNVYGNLLQEGARNRAYGRQEGEKTSAAVGGLARDIGETIFNKGNQTKTPTVTPPKQRAGSQAGIPAGQLPGYGMPIPQAPPFAQNGIPGGQLPGTSTGMPGMPAPRPFPGRVTPPVFGGPSDPWQVGAQVRF